MEFPGLITIAPDQTDLIDDAARILGDSFLEERWTATYLDALSETDARKREISRAMLREEIAGGAAYRCAVILPDRAGAAMGFLGSDMKASGTTWPAIEEKAHERLARTVLTEDEAQKLEERGRKMAAISNFGWGERESAEMGYSDYIYFAAWAVDAGKRGSGAFRRLIDPMFDFADKHGIPCFLECYASSLESLYTHIGFDTFRVFEDPAFDIKQTCMVRHPDTLRKR